MSWQKYGHIALFNNKKKALKYISDIILPFIRSIANSAPVQLTSAIPWTLIMNTEFDFTFIFTFRHFFFHDLLANYLLIACFHYWRHVLSNGSIQLAFIYVSCSIHLQSQTSANTIMADVVNFVCLQHLEERALVQETLF